jgi:glucan 1,4-alpha-glucosidase
VHVRAKLIPLLTAVATAAGLVALTPPVLAAAAAPPSSPGAESHYGLARKDCLGTARNTASKAWFTVANGVLSDVYYPTMDNTNVETLQYVVTDGRSFTDLQTRDTTYTVAALDQSGMTCRVTSTARSGNYRIVTDYLTDPARASVLMDTKLLPAKGAGPLELYVRFDPNANGNGGGGTGNAGADDAVTDTSTGSPVPVASDTVTATTAANNDYRQPVYAALRGDRPFRAVSSGYAGTASDGLTQLDADHRLATTYPAARNGNVVQTAQVALHRNRATLALGFGTTARQAVGTAGASVGANPARTFRSYVGGWRAYDRGLRPPPSPEGLPASRRAALARAYWLSVNVLKASEDKTFPGAIAASLSSPWGQAVSAGDPAQTYFGSYREVFARDLYETFTGLLAAGDVATARDTVRFLFERQQQADGSIPRNSLLNGKLAPDSNGIQLDENAFPLLMARSVGLTGPAFYTQHIRRAADFVVAHGPAFGAERWEEQSGYSPSTIAAQIAGLVAAGAIADANHDPARARIYRAAADDFQRQVKDWTVTTNGPLSTQPYFIRLSKAGDPNAATTYNLGNGSVDADQRTVIDQGFLELPRLGVLPDDDPDVARSLALVDSVISRTTPSGAGVYRYGTPAAGSEDGYGDCNVADPTSCTVEGKPWPGSCQNETNSGTGHLWPVLSGERAEHEIAVGDTGAAASRWDFMNRTASGLGMVPEQAWEDADVPPSPFGTDPECASIGFVDGKAAGSASPLTWAQAQFVRLAAGLRTGNVVGRPADTVRRYVKHTQGSAPLTLTAPTDQAQLSSGSVTLIGTTAPRARVDVLAVNLDVNGAAAAASTTAAADGSFSVPVAVPPGTASIDVAATAPDGGTAFARRTVVWDVAPGTRVFAASDPDGDDNGPGTYAYPSAADFHPGAFDLQAFEVYDSGPDAVTFRVRTRDLSETFGSPLGAQLLDVYVDNPAGGATSTAASFPGRNYAIDPGSAWNRLIEVQGFGSRFIDGSGSTVGAVQERGNAVTRYITFTVTKSALGGTPGSGWGFTVVLTGQDGFSPDQARGFTATAGSYSFGVCTAAAAAASNAICDVPPDSVPKAIDVLTPAGVSQSTELDPTAPPVTLQAVRIP